MRRFGIPALVAALVLFIALFIYQGRGELTEVWSLLTSLNPLWLIPLALLQAGIVLSAAVIYRTTLRRLGERVRVLFLAEVQLKRILVGTVTPVGGPPSIWVMVRSLETLGVRPGHTLVTATMRTFGTMIAFALWLPPALLVQPPGTAMILASIASVLMIVALAIPLIYLFRDIPLPGWIERYTPQRVQESVQSLREHQIGLRDLAVPVTLGVFWHMSMMAMLFIALLAVGFEASMTVVLLGYVAGNLAYLITPVFRGVGAVEFAMVFALQRAGVPAVEAVGAALLYRVGDLWIPLFAALVHQAVRMPVVPQFVGYLRGVARVAPRRGNAEARPVPAVRSYHSSANVPAMIEVAARSDHQQHYEVLSPEQRRNRMNSASVVTPTYPG